MNVRTWNCKLDTGDWVPGVRCMYLMVLGCTFRMGVAVPALRISFLRSLTLDPGLVHQIRNALFQIVDAVAHVIDARYYLVRHRLELVLNVLQQILYLITGGRFTGCSFGVSICWVVPGSGITHVYGQLLHVLGVRIAVQGVVLVQIAVHLVAQIGHSVASL